jgi:hypothetical protein
MYYLTFWSHTYQPVISDVNFAAAMGENGHKRKRIMVADVMGGTPWARSGVASTTTS